ncbi:hypothetical protein CkaCkLH20_13327 [Colletotrichum karsti]|uniref:Uncharacterized protein n=1 Tax=Colletotrichum karsti TaxID=1095194 RepID=A0A9P6HVU3_9PEZI|nr:uncharacterized protein CkaCkLH20_13327 [Colletotrichum karsti]KAF9869196.1 hypothetical protein CkaCkLH20_13327 [Colletotrichum karsti]
MPQTTTEKKRKRRAREATEAAPDRKRQTKEDAFLSESESVRERARPYLLAVAKMPVDTLGTRWSVGRNRPLEAGHARELKEVFKRSGLERRAPEHRILVLCGAEEVRRMRSAQPGSDRGGEDDFLGWAAVIGSTPEVMAGQHRIEALRAYVKETGGSASDL